MKRKYVIFDFDGTLTVQQNGMTMWGLIWASINKAELGRRLYNEYHSGMISRKQWFLETERAFADSVDESLISSVSKSITLRNNAGDVIKKLSDKNISLYILSGGIKRIVYEVLMEKTVFFEDISANDMVFDGGKLKRIEMTPYDYKGKADYIMELVKRKNSDYKNVYYVGNSINDIEAFALPIQTICISPLDISRKQVSLCNYCCRDLKDVSDYILKEALI